MSGNACNNGVDDMAYVRALVASVGKHLSVDGKRGFATGFSNGAALSHRLGCEASYLFAAVAPISGQTSSPWSTAAATPSQRVACSTSTAPPTAAGLRRRHLRLHRQRPLRLGGGDAADWGARNGCGAATQTALPLVAPAEGTNVVRHAYACATGGELQQLQIVGGGHYWPRGSSFSVTGNSGGVPPQQLDASRAVIDWFGSHARP